ncbi:prepilin-type N-terminal cleavage/methylation domain-containing protein [Massilia sp. 9096]|uniref:type IV pilus modification PilV family protein n=1 Tax=Massilia sp. 9096 TaxID=1500894 RepID=UPI00055E02B0|nr:prepilin-type N-terminal cleavage/methylation domain-containing protein [Massilia sp. 9096]
MMRAPRPQHGIALVEAMVAIVILALGLLGTIGMQARSYTALADAGLRAEATMAAEKLVGLMTTDQANLTSYALAAGATPGARLLPWYNETRSHIPNAKIAVTVAPAANTNGMQVVITIGWTRKAGTAPASHRVSAYIAQST